MRSHLIAATAFLWASGAFGADGITAVRDGSGRVVFVNAEMPAHQGASPSPGSECVAPRTSYVYWSVTQRRWKRVPSPSAAQVRNACSAAREVEATLARPAAPAKNAAPELSVVRPAAWTSTAVDGLIDEVAKRHDVDPNLVRAMIKAESNFNTRAVSRKGAIGLMQLMPATARELKVNPYDPAQNIDGGVRHMKSLLEKNNGDVALSLAAYNAGQGAVERHGGVPNYKETKSYVRKITDMYADPGSSGRAATGRSAIKETKDVDGHRLYTND